MTYSYSVLSKLYITNNGSTEYHQVVFAYRTTVYDINVTYMNSFKVLIHYILLKSKPYVKLM